jgi:HK97 gp10 family phage protein
VLKLTDFLLNLYVKVKTQLQFDTNKWSAKLKKISGQIDKEVEQAVAVATRNTSAAAKSFVTVDKGGLKQSIRAVTKGKTGEVKVGASYGPYVEYGTGKPPFLIVPNELKEYAKQFKGKGIRQVNLPARPFLYPAYFIQRVKFIDDCKRRINKLIA